MIHLKNLPCKKMFCKGISFSKKKLVLLPLLLCLLLSTAAAEAGKVFWGTVEGTKAIVYVQDPGEIASLSAQVGTVESPTVNQTPLSAVANPVDTVILVDNSLSIPKARHTAIAEFLDDLIGARITGERFTIACLSDSINYLCQEETDYTKLKEAIGNIQYQNQETYITDVLYELLETLQSKKDGIFKRIIIISDGVDNKEVGYTREELYQLMDATKYPIYAVGCKNNTAQSGQELENFFAMARRTSGNAYELEDNSMNMVAAVTASNTAHRVELELPAAMCDGTQKGVRIVTKNAEGTELEYTVQLTMPFATTPAPEPEPTPEPPAPAPEPIPEPEPEPSPVVPIVIGVVAVLAIVGIAAVVITKRKKAKAFVTPSTKSDDVTEVCEPTVVDIDDADAIFQNPQPRTLVLTDLYDNTRRFETPLKGLITVGKSNDCKICISYEPTVSRQQCEIAAQNGRVMITNKSNTNITVLDGQPVNSSTELRDGGIIKMGRVQMKVEIH